jgi:hypothetical protein
VLLLLLSPPHIVRLVGSLSPTSFFIEKNNERSEMEVKGANSSGLFFGQPYAGTCESVLLKLELCVGVCECACV